MLNITHAERGHSELNGKIHVFIEAMGISLGLST